MKSALLTVALLLAGACLLPGTVHAAPPAGTAIAAAAPRCAASVEEAARGIVAGTNTVAGEGYRVQDLLIDPVLRKAWVRVADCHDARRPLTLVALSATLAGGNAPGTQATETSARFAPAAGPSRSAAVLEPAASGTLLTPPITVAPANLPLIARGDAVEVFVQSSSVHMVLVGHASSPAAAGAEVDVVLDAPRSLADQAEAPAPPRHMRGIATGAHRVEVQP